ncbi:hypothetical protein HYW59_00055 [Candidatus Kaiserbacteria bacterium]|nr:hypothetical protein [Candidatus Kaiserbacteria bacterium]
MLEGPLDKREPVFKHDESLAREDTSAREDETFSRALNRWSAKPSIKAKQEQIDRTETFRGSLEKLVHERNVMSTIKNPATGDEMNVLDEQALRKAIDASFAKARSWGDRLPKDELIAALSIILGDRPVLTREQVVRGDWQPKSFFYIPESSSAAVDITAIKSSPPFHHFATDLVLHGDQFEYPFRERGGDSVTSLETRTAALIFHPQYGDGFRNEKGQLMVRDLDTRDYVQFSGGFLREHGIGYKKFGHQYGTASGKKGLWGRAGSVEIRSVREGVTAGLPNLVRKGLIRPVEDFKQMTYGRVHVDDQRVERAGVSSAGSRHIRGVIHYIGKEFIGKDVRIVDISPTLGAVIETSGGGERVTHTFNIISRDQAKSGKSNMWLAGAPLTQTRPFSAEAVALPRRTDESLEQYHDRTEKTDRGLAHLLLHVIPKYPALSKMLRDKPTYELASIAQAAYLLERDKQARHFDEFVKAHGELGIRTFLVTGNNDELREKVFEFSRSSSSEHVQKVFQAYGQLIDSVDNLHVYLSEQFGDANKEAVNEIATRRLKVAERLLAAAYENKDDTAKLDELSRAAEANNILITASRVLKERGELDLALMRDAEILSVRGGDISPQDAEAVKALQYQRYGDGKVRADEGYTLDTVEGAMAGLEKALEQKTSRFHLFRLDGKVVACVRFDQQDEAGQHTENPTRLYMATVMGDKAIAGGKLAEANAEAAFRQEQKQGLPICATAKPELQIAEKYLEWGFVARSASMYKNLPILNIEWDPRSAIDDSSTEAYVFPSHFDGKGMLARPSRKDHETAFALHADKVLTRLYYDEQQQRYCGVYARGARAEVSERAAA